MSHNQAGNQSQFSFPNIESFKLKSHADNELMLLFLKERQALETTYANDLIKLVEKFRPQCNHRPNVDKLLDFTAALTKDHAQVAKFLSSTANMFERHIMSERRSITGLQSSLVNSVGPERLAKLAKAEKSKEIYLKKMTENSVVSQRTYETTQELQEITQAYRDDIVDLETNRSIILDGREFAKRTFDKYESESHTKIQGFYKAFAKSIETLAKNKLKAADTFAQITQGLKGYRFDEVHFENFWPIPPNVYFEHYESGSPLKDLIFGVPLSFTFRNLPAVLPPFLKFSIEQIDKRGLHVEGLYRVSAKNSDRDKARIELETDVNAFNWDNADIHLLTGLIKAYLRELPDPLFPFPRVDRDAYSAMGNESSRVVKLTTMVKGLHRNNMTALKFLLEHLNRVNAHHDKNKMGTENISLIFSALLFECQNVGRSAGGGGGGGGGEKDKEKEKSSHSWFKLGSKSSKQEKEEKKSGIHGDRASYLATGSSNNQLGPASTEMVADSFKNDLVLSDLMRHIEVLFADNRKSEHLSSASLLTDLSSPLTPETQAGIAASPGPLSKTGSLGSLLVTSPSLEPSHYGSKTSVKVEDRDPLHLDDLDPGSSISRYSPDKPSTFSPQEGVTSSPSSKETLASSPANTTTTTTTTILPRVIIHEKYDKSKQDKSSGMMMGGLRTDIKKDRSGGGGGNTSSSTPFNKKISPTTQSTNMGTGAGGADQANTFSSMDKDVAGGIETGSIGHASTLTSASIASALKTTMSNSSLNNLALTDILPTSKP